MCKPLEYYHGTWVHIIRSRGGNVVLSIRTMPSARGFTLKVYRLRVDF